MAVWAVLAGRDNVVTALLRLFVVVITAYVQNWFSVFSVKHSSHTSSKSLRGQKVRIHSCPHYAEQVPECAPHNYTSVRTREDFFTTGAAAAGTSAVGSVSGLPSAVAAAFLAAT